MKLRFVPTLAAAIVWLSWLGATAAGPPDIVLFISDDHGWADSSVYGARDIRTPNMMRLAKDGMTLTHMFVASPSCAPSRAALLTGLMPARNGAEANHSRPRDDIKKLPAYLHELGYEVAAFGKVAHYKQAGLYGFDHVGERYDAVTIRKYLNDRDATKPLCLLVGTDEPHVPWPDNVGYDPAAIVLPATHVDTPETRQFRAQYYTDIEQADTLLGQIYDLARKRLGRDLLFIYTSDHGAQWPFGKWNLYDAGTRVPFIAVWPGVTGPDSRQAALVSWIDILPTLVDVAGGQPPTGIDGRSFADVLRHRKATHRDEIFTTHSGDGNMNVYPIRSVRTQRWKYVRNLHPEFLYTTHIDRAKNKDGVKYWRTWEAAAQSDPHAAAAVARYHRRPAEELYDLRTDPDEQHNLAADPRYAETLADLGGRVTKWMAQQGDTGTVFGTPRRDEQPGERDQ